MTNTKTRARLCAGITKQNEIYFLEITLPSKTQEHFSMSGFTVEPIEENEAIDMAENYLQEGDEWKMAVADDRTELSKEEYCQQILAIDGWEQVLDTSLYSETVEIDGGTYHFLSGSCGQHQEKELKKYYIPTHIYNELMRCWDAYHLKKEVEASDLAMLKKLIAAQSDEMEKRQVIMAVKEILH